MNESYWQRGCNDGYENKPPQYPNQNGPWDRLNEGYSNGYEYGQRKWLREDARAREAIKEAAPNPFGLGR